LPGLVEAVDGRVVLRVDAECGGTCPRGLSGLTAIVGADGETRATTNWNFTNAWPSKVTGPQL
jgi:hypothetical protein